MQTLRFSRLELIVPAILCLGGMLFAWWCLLNHDAGDFLAIAELVWGGKHYYKDILDINTPMIVYMSLVPIALHMATGLSQIKAFFLCVFVLLNGCIFLACSILRPYALFAKPANRLFLLVTVYYGLFILPNGHFDFGQREHLFCALILPYLALVLLASEKPVPAHWQQLAAGILAGVGFALKPTFPLLFIVAELFIIIRRKTLRCAFRPETILIAGINLLYYASIIIGSPEALKLFPIGITNFIGYHSPFPVILSHALEMFYPAVIWMYWGRKASPYRPWFWLLFALSAAASLFYIVQRCDYFYHLFPLVWLELLLGALVAAVYWKKPYGYAFLLLHASLSFNMPAIEARGSYRQAVFSLADVMAKNAQGRPVAILSSDVSPAFPSINYANVPWGLTTMLLTHLPTAYMAQRDTTHGEPVYHTLDKMTPEERLFHEHIIADIQRRPGLIIVDNSPDKLGFPGMKFDFLHYFLLDPRFAAEWQHYAPLQTIGAFAVYKLEE